MMGGHETIKSQLRRIGLVLPVQQGNVSICNAQVLNVILYVAEQGCKWRAPPKQLGNWHTIYKCMNRWLKSGVLQCVFDQPITRRLDNKAIYRRRNEVERLFWRLKMLRPIFSRFEKLGVLSMWFYLIRSRRGINSIVLAGCESFWVNSG